MDELVKRLRELPHLLFVQLHGHEDVVYQAADAIEELSLTAESYKRSMEAWADEAANAQPRWISVTERLPEDRQSVLVHRDDGGIFIFEYFTTSPTDECWIDDHLNVYSAYCVTHWMSLPEPPKEET